MARYLALTRKDAPKREYNLYEAFNDLRWIVRTAAQWRMMPNDLPPWHTVYQQSQSLLKAGVLESMVGVLRALLRLAQARSPNPSVIILDSRTVQSTPESGSRSGFDGYKKRNGSKAHMAVYTLGTCSRFTSHRPMNRRRLKWQRLRRDPESHRRECRGGFVDQGYTAAEHSIRLEVIKHSECQAGLRVPNQALDR